MKPTLLCSHSAAPIRSGTQLAVLMYFQDLRKCGLIKLEALQAQLHPSPTVLFARSFTGNYSREKWRYRRVAVGLRIGYLGDEILGCASEVKYLNTISLLVYKGQRFQLDVIFTYLRSCIKSKGAKALHPDATLIIVTIELILIDCCSYWVRQYKCLSFL